MFGGFASFVYRNRRRVLLVALLGIAVAGVLGLGVAKRLSPYGDTDPSTQSVQATNRYQAATGRQIDPGVVALVQTGGVRTARAELFAFPIIFLLSLLFFRSLVASLLPPFLGVLAILLTFFTLRIVSSFTDLSVFAQSIVTGLGLGLAIDYSLFMVSRYREEAALTGFGVDALCRTVATSGRTIAFSSVTVAAALASLTIFPQNFLFSMGLAGAVVALVAAMLALVVLPAMLAVLGPRINALAPKWLQHAADRDALSAETGFWY